MNGRWAQVALLLVVGCNRPLPLGGGGDGGSGDLSSGCGKSCCKSNQDCSAGGTAQDEECLAPTEFAGCGDVAGGVMCFSDSDCAGDAGGMNLPPNEYGGPICDDPTHYQMCGGLYLKLCISGCARDGDCVGGRICDSTQHCVFPPCSSDGDCPANFNCGGTRCQRKSCLNDGDCGGGFCVNGSCYDGYGTCVPYPV
jgi:hypothetical protein